MFFLQEILLNNLQFVLSLRLCLLDDLVDAVVAILRTMINHVGFLVIGLLPRRVIEPYVFVALLSCLGLV